jgi:hypothetical protein
LPKRWKTSSFHVAYLWKPKPYIRLQQQKFKSKKPCMTFHHCQFNIFLRSSMSFIYLFIIALEPLLELGRFISFLILYRVGRIPWTWDQPVARPLPTDRTTQTQNKLTQHRHPCLERDSNSRSQSSSEWRQFMPQTARTLWSAFIYLCFWFI